MGSSASRGSVGGILGSIRNAPARERQELPTPEIQQVVDAVRDQTIDMQNQSQRRGRASTILTGEGGLLEEPFTTRKLLLGF